MKTDSLFYRLFLEFPQFFFELIGRSPEAASGYQFTSIEVKQLAFRLDGLFLPTRDEANQPFYLVEVQFQPDSNLYYRLFSELFLYLRQYQPAQTWNVVIIYPSRKIEREAIVHFGNLLQLSQVRRIYLDEIPEEENYLGIGVVKLVVESEEQVVNSAKRLIQQAQQQLNDEAVQNNLIDLIETIVVYKLPQKSRQEIAAMFSLGDLKKTKFYQEAYQEGKQEGKQEGEQEGERKGEMKAKLEAIPELLKEGLTVEQIAKALKLPLDVIEQVSNN
jgi:predicted transposase/invertase (TIGR01784 family)